MYHVWCGTTIWYDTMVLIDEGDMVKLLHGNVNP